MSGKTCLIFCLLILLFGTFCEAGKKPDYCTVCRVIVQEVEWLISQEDPKKTIQVGSFRVDPNGNQDIKDKQYARSDSHLEELFESVCDRMHSYGELTAEDGTKHMVRTIGFKGETLSTKDVQLDRSKGRSFKYQCEYFLDDHEEELIALLQQPNIPDYTKLVCGDEMGVCTEQKLSTPMPTLPEATDEEIETKDVVVDNNDVDDDDDDDDDEKKEDHDEEGQESADDKLGKVEL